VEFLVERNELLKALKSVGRAIGKIAQAMPILSYVGISYDGNEVALIATDLEVGVRVPFPTRGKRVCDVLQAIVAPIGVAVPARLFTDSINAIPSQCDITVSIDTTTHQVLLAYQKAKTKIAGAPLGDIPPIPGHGEGIRTMTIPMGVLTQLITPVRHAVSADDSRPVLTAVLLRQTPTTLLAAGADGYRIARSVVPIKGNEGNEGSEDLLLPSKPIDELLRLRSSYKVADEAPVSIDIRSNGVIFTVIRDDGKKHTVVSRLIDGKYPDFERIYPATHTTEAVLDADDLIAAVRQAALFSKTSRHQNAVRLDIPANEEEAQQMMAIRVTSSAEEGEYQADIDCVSEGDGCVVALNTGFLLDALQLFIGKEIIIRSGGEKTPVLLSQRYGGTADCLLMPMSLR